MSSAKECTASAVVVWLMIWHGFKGIGVWRRPSSASSTAELEIWCVTAKRWTQDQVSSATGGYCQARQKLPKLIASQVSERIVEQLRTEMQEGWKGLQRPVFVIDGSTLQLKHEPELVRPFPLGAINMGKIIGQ